MNWRTCQVGATRMTYCTFSRPTRPLAVHASFSHSNVNDSTKPRRPWPLPSPALAHCTRWPSAENERRSVTPIQLNRVITLAEAQRTVLEACPPLAPVDVDRTAALGLVLAADVVAGEDVPPFANSAVDGYAVRAADVGDVPGRAARSWRGRGGCRRACRAAAAGRGGPAS